MTNFINAIKDKIAELRTDTSNISDDTRREAADIILVHAKNKLAILSTDNTKSLVLHQISSVRTYLDSLIRGNMFTYGDTATNVRTISSAREQLLELKSIINTYNHSLVGEEQTIELLTIGPLLIKFADERNFTSQDMAIDFLIKKRVEIYAELDDLEKSLQILIAYLREVLVGKFSS